MAESRYDVTTSRAAFESIKDTLMDIFLGPGSSAGSQYVPDDVAKAMVSDLKLEKGQTVSKTQIRAFLNTKGISGLLATDVAMVLRNLYGITPTFDEAIEMSHNLIEELSGVLGTDYRNLSEEKAPPQYMNEEVLRKLHEDAVVKVFAESKSTLEEQIVGELSYLSPAQIHEMAIVHDFLIREGGYEQIAACLAKGGFKLVESWINAVARPHMIRFLPESTQRDLDSIVEISSASPYSFSTSLSRSKAKSAPRPDASAQTASEPEAEPKPAKLPAIGHLFGPRSARSDKAGMVPAMAGMGFSTSGARDRARGKGRVAAPPKPEDSIFAKMKARAERAKTVDPLAQRQSGSIMDLGKKRDAYRKEKGLLNATPSSGRSEIDADERRAQKGDVDKANDAYFAAKHAYHGTSGSGGVGMPLPKDVEADKPGIFKRGISHIMKAVKGVFHRTPWAKGAEPGAAGKVGGVSDKIRKVGEKGKELDREFECVEAVGQLPFSVVEDIAAAHDWLESFDGYAQFEACLVYGGTELVESWAQSLMDPDSVRFMSESVQEDLQYLSELSPDEIEQQKKLGYARGKVRAAKRSDQAPDQLAQRQGIPAAERGVKTRGRNDYVADPSASKDAMYNQDVAHPALSRTGGAIGNLQQGKIKGLQQVGNQLMKQPDEPAPQPGASDVAGLAGAPSPIGFTPQQAGRQAMRQAGSLQKQRAAGLQRVAAQKSGQAPGVNQLNLPKDVAPAPAPAPEKVVRGVSAMGRLYPKEAPAPEPTSKAPWAKGAAPEQRPADPVQARQQGWGEQPDPSPAQAPNQPKQKGFLARGLDRVTAAVSGQAQKPVAQKLPGVAAAAGMGQPAQAGGPEPSPPAGQQGGPATVKITDPHAAAVSGAQGRPAQASAPTQQDQAGQQQTGQAQAGQQQKPKGGFFRTVGRLAKNAVGHVGSYLSARQRLRDPDAAMYLGAPNARTAKMLQRGREAQLHQVATKGGYSGSGAAKMLQQYHGQPAQQAPQEYQGGYDAPQPKNAPQPQQAPQEKAPQGQAARAVSPIRVRSAGTGRSKKAKMPRPAEPAPGTP